MRAADAAAFDRNTGQVEVGFTGAVGPVRMVVHLTAADDLKRRVNREQHDERERRENQQIRQRTHPLATPARSPWVCSHWVTVVSHRGGQRREM